MKTIQVFDPPMCCSTGICGPNIDPDLVNFAAMLSQLANMGVKSSARTSASSRWPSRSIRW